MLSAFLWNTGSEPIRLSWVSMTGTYSGRLEVVRMEVAPLRGTHARPRPYQRSLGVVPGGVYTTYPPAFRERGDPCHVQELRPVSGYRLGQDRMARVLVWLRAVAPGPFHVEGHRVVYEQGGSQYQQVLFIGVRGRVEEGASRRALPDDPGEVACAREPGVKLLNAG